MSVRPRRHSPAVDTTGDSGAKVAGFNGLTQTSPEWARGAIITLVASAASGNNTFQLQYTPDGGTTWLNYGAISGTLITAGTAALIVYPANFAQTSGPTPTQFTTGATVTVAEDASIPPVWRLVYTVPTSITITGVYVNYLP